MKTTTRSYPAVTRPHVLRRAAAEFVGTGLLVTCLLYTSDAADE